jgi:hypothetical protein
MKDTENIATIAGIPHTKVDVMAGLVNHLPAIRHLWPDWGVSDQDKHVTPSVSQKMLHDPYPTPTDYQGYTIYPPASFSDRQKWKWLIELLSRAGEIHS